MIWRSTTLRFALLVFVLQVAACIAVMAIVGESIRRNTEHEAAMRADGLRDELLAAYVRDGLSGLAEAVRVRADDSITPSTVVLLANDRGKVIAGNLDDWPASLDVGTSFVPLTLYLRKHSSPEATWVRAMRLTDGARLLTGGVVEGERRLMMSFRTAMVFAIFLALLFAAVAAWLVARMIVGRMEVTVATLEAAREGDLSRRVGYTGTGDAFDMLAKSVNATLERVDGLVNELKLATDGLAHDLKAPLTRLRSALERGAATATEQTSQAAFDNALLEGDRVLTIVKTALSISRAEGGIGRESFVDVNVGDELQAIAEIYGPVVEDDGRELAVVAMPGIVISIHRELLGQAIGNLIDNSLKYGAGRITLEATATGTGVEITVSDQGGGISTSRHEQALARFGRLDEARRTAGAGLGLSLVSAVARLHGGMVSLSDAKPGLIVVLSLPNLTVSSLSLRPATA